MPIVPDTLVVSFNLRAIAMLPMKNERYRRSVTYHPWSQPRTGMSSIINHSLIQTFAHLTQKNLSLYLSLPVLLLIKSKQNKNIIKLIMIPLKPEESFT